MAEGVLATPTGQRPKYKAVGRAEQSRSSTGVHCPMLSNKGSLTPQQYQVGSPCVVSGDIPILLVLDKLGAGACAGPPQCLCLYQ